MSATNDLNHVKTVIDGYQSTWIQLKGANGGVIVPLNPRKEEFERRKNEIWAFLENPNTPPGYYTIQLHRVRKEPFFSITYIKQGQKNGDETPPPPPAPIPELRKAPAEPLPMSISELLELRVKCERLEMENLQLRAELEDLQSLDDEAEPIGDSPSVKLIETLMPLADAFFQTWNKKIEVEAQKNQIEAAKIQIPQLPPPQDQEVQQQITLEDLNQVKKENPQAFYNWLSIPDNAEFYQNLQNGL